MRVDSVVVFAVDTEVVLGADGTAEVDAFAENAEVALDTAGRVDLVLGAAGRVVVEGTPPRMLGGAATRVEVTVFPDDVEVVLGAAGTAEVEALAEKAEVALDTAGRVAVEGTPPRLLESLGLSTEVGFVIFIPVDSTTVLNAAEDTPPRLLESPSVRVDLVAVFALDTELFLDAAGRVEVEAFEEDTEVILGAFARVDVEGSPPRASRGSRGLTFVVAFALETVETPGGAEIDVWPPRAVDESSASI
jgi:hypothetical protein